MRVMLTADPSVDVERSKREGKDVTAHSEQMEEKGHTLAIRTDPLEASSTSRRVDMDAHVVLPWRRWECRCKWGEYNWSAKVRVLCKMIVSTVRERLKTKCMQALRLLRGGSCVG